MGRQFEPLELKCGRDNAADQRPGPEAGSFLPYEGWNNTLEAFAVCGIRTELDRLAVSAGRPEAEHERRTGLPNPDFRGVDAMPMRAFTGGKEE